MNLRLDWSLVLYMMLYYMMRFSLKPFFHSFSSSFAATFRFPWMSCEISNNPNSEPNPFVVATNEMRIQTHLRIVLCHANQSNACCSRSRMQMEIFVSYRSVVICFKSLQRIPIHITYPKSLFCHLYPHYLHIRTFFVCADLILDFFARAVDGCFECMQNRRLPRNI